MFKQDAKQAIRIFASREDAKTQGFVFSWLPGFQIHPLLLALALLLFCGKMMAAPTADFDAANRLFDKEDFQGARSGYEALVQSGHWNANLFYNLGNAAFRLHDKGAAFLAYERALVLEPGHPEAKANLNFLRGETGAKLPVTPWYGRALSWPSGNEAAWLASGSFFGLCFCLLPLIWKGKAATLPAVFCALALIWSGAVVGWQASRGETWIVTADEAKARTTPADSSPATATLPMGSHVRLLLERGPWLQVQLPEENAGWISRDSVQPVRLARK